MSEIEEPLANARSRIRARDGAAAEALLRRALVIAPRQAEVLHWLGLLAGRAGRDAECVGLLEAAIAHGSAEQRAATGLLLGAAHERAGRADEAERTWRDVVRIAPGQEGALLKLGLLVQRGGRHAEAVALLRRAVDADPGQPVAHAALAASLHALGDLDAAVASASEATRLAPGSADFTGTLAAIRNAQGRFAEAAALCRSALALVDDPALWNTLGIALKEEGALDEAAAAFERALARQPRSVDARFNLAAVRKDQGRADEAVAMLRAVVAAAPDLAAARLALCMAHLVPVCRDEAEVERRRADYEAELGALIALAARDPAPLAAGVGAAQPFHLASHGRNDRALQQRYGALVCSAMAAAYPAVPLAASPEPGERIRLGVVCGYFRDHSVWRLPTRGWIEGIDRGQFALTGYHTSAQCDAGTARAGALFDRFVQGPLTTEGWRERIAADQPHALIYPEIGMDPMTARLAAMRLAPVQYASWGHPSTSGYSTIDHYLSSAAMEPPNADRHYTERLVRLPGLSTPLAVQRYEGPPPARASLGLPETATVFWSGQSLHKYRPADDDVFAAIAERVPGARFLFVANSGGLALTVRLRERLARAFARRGLDAAECCVFLPRLMPGAYRAAVGCADVVLDSPGWSGCNTLLDALAHALPIVTMRGATMRGAHGAAILQSLGLDRLVCEDRDTYIRTAAASAGDRDMRHEVRFALDAAGWRLEGREPVLALERHVAAAVSAATV